MKLVKELIDFNTVKYVNLNTEKILENACAVFDQVRDHGFNKVFLIQMKKIFLKKFKHG